LAQEEPIALDEQGMFCCTHEEAGMKISDFVPQIKTDNRVQKVKNTSATDATDSTEATTGSDSVQLSASSIDVQKMKMIIQDTPAVRMDRVQALKQQIESGEYQVDPYRVADKMLMNLLSEGGSADS
jgi:negative regulator of flagellin synthesis FlgM